jgi:hypothetical protein
MEQTMKSTTPKARPRVTRDTTGSGRAKPVKPVRLILLGDGSLRPFIGVHAIPNHLPELLRYPGESAQAFSHRVLHAVTGSGVVRGMLMYPGEPGAVTVCRRNTPNHPTKPQRDAP